MRVTQSVTTSESIPWRRPHRVEVHDGYLLADFKEHRTYPLLEAAQGGRGLRVFIEARTDEDVSQFTKNWGLLYPRLEGDRSDRFPVDLFHLERRKCLAIIRLGAALRGGAAEVMRALQELATVKAEWQVRIYGGQPNDHVGEQLPEHERELAGLGIPVSQLLRARHEKREVSLQELGAQALAAELQMPHFLRAMRQNREWSLEETPAAHTLEQVLRWSCRSQYRTLHHFFCESCGEASVSRRSDARFCGEKCGSRARVRRFRGSHASR